MIALLTVLLLAATDEPVPAARFAFLKPNVTTKADAVGALGEPYKRYPSKVPEGEIDVFVRALDFESRTEVAKRAAKRGVKPVAVEVLEWEIARDSVEMAKLVCRGDKLWYAIHPVSPSESSPEKIEARWGKPPRRSERETLIADIHFTVDVYAYPEDGVAYLQRDSDAALDRKVVFPPVRPR